MTLATPKPAIAVNRNAQRFRMLLYVNVILMAALILGLLGFLAQGEGRTSLNVQADKALLDLSDYALDDIAPVSLDGQWHFYWLQRLTPGAEGPSGKASLMMLPSSWNIATPQAYPVEGFATLQLRIKTDKVYQTLALVMPEIGSAYRLYIDDTLITNVGNFATNQEVFEPEFDAQLVHFAPPSDDFLLTLHVANFGYGWGGLWETPKLGTLDNAVSKELTRAVSSAFLLGLFAIAALLGVIQFALRPSDLLPLTLALLCLSLAIRELFEGHLLGLMDANFLPFIWHLRIDYLTFNLSMLAWLAFMQVCFPQEFKRWALRVFYLFFALMALTVLMTPVSFFSPLLYPMQVMVLVVMFYNLFKLVMALKNKRPGAKVIGFCALLLSLIMLNDILYTSEIISTGQFLSYGVVTLIVCIMYVSFKRFVQLLDQSQTLSAQLSERNDALAKLSTTLEQQVQDRTQALEAVNVKLQALAQQDPLTSLLNRRGMRAPLEHMLAKLRRDNTPFSIVLIDLDNFKSINDNYGHDVGDEVLVACANLLTKRLRAQDYIARWGGEEMLLCLPDTQAKQAQELAESLRQSIETSLPQKITAVSSVSATFGVAECHRDETFKQCLARADQALYAGKSQGRNQVVISEG